MEILHTLCSSTSRSPGVPEYASMHLHHDRRSPSAVPSVVASEPWARCRVRPNVAVCAHRWRQEHVVCVSVLFCSTCVDYLRTPPFPADNINGQVNKARRHAERVRRGTDEICFESTAHERLQGYVASRG